MSSAEHEAFIKTPKQLITVVVLSFVVPILIIVLLVKYVNAGNRGGSGNDALSAEATEARIQPVARFELKGAGGPKALRAGEAVYKAQCAACHEVGAAGAPKFGDAAAWGPRIKTGYEALLASALKGKGAMAAQGGGEFEDVEIGRAIVHLVNGSGGKFDEPKLAVAAPAAGEKPASGDKPAADGAAAAAAPAAGAAASSAAAAPAAGDKPAASGENPGYGGAAPKQ